MNYQIIIDDEISYWLYSKAWLRDSLKSYKDKHVDMLISSLGGSVDEALDMYQQLKDHGDVTVYFSGFVASAATIVAMGAKKIIMSKNCLALFHKCSGHVSMWGNYNSDEIAQAIKELEKQKKTNDKTDAVIANIYQDKCKKKCDNVEEIITEAEWHNADECLALGFVDEIGGTSAKAELTDHLDRIISLNNYPKIPEKFKAHVTTGNGITAFVSRITDEIKLFLNNTNEMAKKYLAVGKVIGNENFALAEGAKEMKITEVELDKLENKLIDQAKQAKLDAEKIKTLQAEITSKDEKITELSALPGAEVNKGADDDGEKKTITAQTMFDEIKDYL